MGSDGAAAGLNLTVTYNLDLPTGSVGDRQMIPYLDNTRVIAVWNHTTESCGGFSNLSYMVSSTVAFDHLFHHFLESDLWSPT